MPQTSLCPRFQEAISLLSRRWTALIVHQLLAGPHRFCTIESSIGISGKVLSDRLKDLEREGIVTRTVIPDTPVIIEYSLTEKGHALKPVLQEIEVWSQEWIEVKQSQP